MTLQVIGAGLARTGTTSLKFALERLLAGRCYHMFDVFENPDHIPVWHDAIRGNPPDWRGFFAGCRAGVDLPVSAFWQDLAEEYPDALIILSVRESAERWWDSMSATIIKAVTSVSAPEGVMADYLAMARDLFEVRLGAGDMTDRDRMISAYQRHNDAARAGAPEGRFLEWQASDGWAPIASALGLPVPSEPFPKANTREQFQARTFGQ